LFDVEGRSYPTVCCSLLHTQPLFRSEIKSRAKVLPFALLNLVTPFAFAGICMRWRAPAGCSAEVEASSKRRDTSGDHQKKSL